MATLTLKNVPDELYARLKRQATANRRSLNQEAIAQLEVAASGDQGRDEAWERATAVRTSGPFIDISPEELEALINEGRD